MSVELLQGDCLELLKDIPTGSVDCVLCDPPFQMTRNSWDTMIPLDRLWGGVKRVCKESAAILFFSQMPFAAKLVMSNEKMFRYEWIWRKSNKTGFLNSKKMPLKAHENILVFYKKLPVYNPQFTGDTPHTIPKSGRKSNNYGKYTPLPPRTVKGYFPSDIISFPCIFHTSEKQVHPTQKPVPLLEYLIKTYTNAGETVLDPTMGSGSTGVACANTGRSFIGMELDAQYFEIASRRIQAAQDAFSSGGVSQ